MQKKTRSIDEVSKRKRLHDIPSARMPDGLKSGLQLLCFSILFSVIVPSMALAEKAWYPLDVDVWNHPFNDQRQRDQKLYTPLNKAQQKWRVRVFIPHLKGAGWMAAGDAGFRKAIKNGDTGSAAQVKLIEAVLDEHAGDLDCIAGTAVTAEFAVKILRRRGLADRIKILSYYYSPGVDRGIRRGGITAALSDLTVLQARIAVNVMVRIIEKRTIIST